MQPDLQHLSPNRKYLIGVSGGRDSVSLLHVLHAAGFKKLVVCHLDHSFRGRQSTADAAFVKKLATRLGFPVEVAKTDVRNLAKLRKLSIETAARRARHEFFAEVSKRHRCRQILVAHHADDAAETTLINLFRGSGRLTRLKSPSEISVGNRRLNFIRPLLTTWRSEIDAYIATHQLDYREDGSNQSPDHLRNRIRHQLVPLLDKVFDRDAAKTLVRSAAIASEESDYLDSLLEGLELAPENAPLSLATTRLQALPLALQRRAIHDWLKRNRVSKISFEKIEACLGLLDTDSGPAKINLPGNRHARRKNRQLFIE